MDEAQRAYLLSLRLLTGRDHSVSELRDKLASKGLDPAAVAETLTRLVTDGYLDDRRFAALFASAALRSGRGFGPRLKLELRRKGVSDEIIAETLAALADEHPEQDVLTQVVGRRFGTFDPEQVSERERRRVFAYLQRRGFSLASILAHFRTIKADDQ